MVKVEYHQRLQKYLVITVLVLITVGNPTSGAKPKKCPSPWRTFKKVCFLFSDTNSQKYQDAQEFCYKKDGFLASIRNSAENGFIVKTIQGMGSSLQRVRWFIGLYQHDPNDNNGYRWLDGSVSGYRNWMNTQPNSVYERCAQIDGSNNFQWRDDICAHRSLFICRKDLEKEGSMSCFKGKPSQPQTLEKKDISVTECIEHCRGLGYPLAGVIPNKCYCFGPNNMKDLQTAQRVECSGLCDGQHCGEQDFITVYNLTYYKETAESCEDLSNLGLSSPSTFVTKNGDERRLQNCFGTIP